MNLASAYLLVTANLVKRVICQIRGHQLVCTTTLNLRTLKDRHTHTCPRCNRVTKDVTKDISPALLELALSFRPVEGLPVAAQQRYMN